MTEGRHNTPDIGSDTNDEPSPNFDPLELLMGDGSIATVNNNSETLLALAAPPADDSDSAAELENIGTPASRKSDKIKPNNDSPPEGETKVQPDGSSIIHYKDTDVSVHVTKDGLVDAVKDKNGVRLIEYSPHKASKEMMVSKISCYSKDDPDLKGQPVELTRFSDTAFAGGGQRVFGGTWKRGDETIRSNPAAGMDDGPIQFRTAVDKLGNIFFVNVQNPKQALVLASNDNTGGKIPELKATEIGLRQTKQPQSGQSPRRQPRTDDQPLPEGTAEQEQVEEPRESPTDSQATKVYDENQWAQINGNFSNQPYMRASLAMKDVNGKKTYSLVRPPGLGDDLGMPGQNFPNADNNNTRNTNTNRYNEGTNSQFDYHQYSAGKLNGVGFTAEEWTTPRGVTAASRVTYDQPQTINFNVNGTERQLTDVVGIATQYNIKNNNYNTTVLFKDGSKQNFSTEIKQNTPLPPPRKRPRM